MHRSPVYRTNLRRTDRKKKNHFDWESMLQWILNEMDSPVNLIFGFFFLAANRFDLFEQFALISYSIETRISLNWKFAIFNQSKITMWVRERKEREKKKKNGRLLDSLNLLKPVYAHTINAAKYINCTHLLPRTHLHDNNNNLYARCIYHVHSRRAHFSNVNLFCRFSHRARHQQNKKIK